MENIISKNNEKIKSAVSLRDSASNRKKSGRFFIEGARLCQDAALSGVNILQLFFTAKSGSKFSSFLDDVIPRAKEVYQISEEVSAKLAGTMSAQGIFCVCEIPESQADFTVESGKKYILLEDVQDPSNVGAIGRTAEALGIDAMIICGGCDIYNPKALRASMGAFFRLRTVQSSIADVASQAKRAGVMLAASTAENDAEKITDVDFSGGFICIIGNEGSGVSQQAFDAADLKITIPMSGRAESLNASTACAIIIWEMMRNGT